MNWFSRKKKESLTQTEERSSTFDYLLYNSGAYYTTSRTLNTSLLVGALV